MSGETSARMLTLTRVLSGLLCFAIGAGIGVVLTFTHRAYLVELGGVPVPLGLLGALAIVAALLIGMRLGFGDRAAVFVAGCGVVLASVVLAFPVGAGSVLVLADPIGYAWALGPALITLATVFWPSPPAPVE